MVTNVFSRIFTDNEHYGEYDKLSYFDSFAYAVQECLYYNRKKDGSPKAIYRMDDRIRLYDYMTLAAHILEASVKDLGKATVEGLIADMKARRTIDQTEETIEYIEDNELSVSCASEILILSLLWISSIYAMRRYMEDHDERWGYASSILGDIMIEEGRLDEYRLEKLLPISSDPLDLMKKHIDWKKSQKAAKATPAKAEDADELHARIKALEAENEELKEQLASVRGKEKGISLGINQAQAALFGLSMANTFGFNCTNKKKELSPMLHKLFGWGESKLAAYISTPCDNDERDELANLFKDLCPPLYATIMNRGKLPPEVTPGK